MLVVPCRRRTDISVHRTARASFPFTVCVPPSAMLYERSHHVAPLCRFVVLCTSTRFLLFCFSPLPFLGCFWYIYFLKFFFWLTESGSLLKLTIFRIFLQNFFEVSLGEHRANGLLVFTSCIYLSIHPSIHILPNNQITDEMHQSLITNCRIKKMTPITYHKSPNSTNQKNRKNNRGLRWLLYVLPKPAAQQPGTGARSRRHITRAKNRSR